MADRDFIVTGDRAALGMLRREHLPALASWFNDPEVRRGLAHRGVVNVEAEEKWFETMTEAGGAPRPSAVAFAIHAADDGELVGACSLEEIDHNFLRAEFGIFMGRRRGEGIGSDAVRLVLDWAFHIIGLRNVMLETYDLNDPRASLRRAGFREIGRRRCRRAGPGTALGADPQDATEPLGAPIRWRGLERRPASGPAELGLELACQRAIRRPSRAGGPTAVRTRDPLGRVAGRDDATRGLAGHVQTPVKGCTRHAQQGRSRLGPGAGRSTGGRALTGVSRTSNRERARRGERRTGPPRGGPIPTSAGVFASATRAKPRVRRWRRSGRSARSASWAIPSS